MTRCWLSRTLELEDPCDYGPTHKPDWMHIGFTENWLMKAPTGPGLGKEDANDARILFDGCRKHHTAYDNKRIRLTREQLPHSVWSYAKDHSLVWKLEAEHPLTDEEARGDMATNRPGNTAEGSPSPPANETTERRASRRDHHGSQAEAGVESP